MSRTDPNLVRQSMLWGRWIGLHTEKEAADAGNDGFGDRLKNPLGNGDEGALARRNFWTARIGRPRQFSEAAHDRLFDVTQLPGAGEFLEGGFLIRQGSKTPLQLDDPDGTLILHRTPIDAQGRLALSRRANQLREQRKTVLPFTELINRWEWPDRLLPVGKEEIGVPGASRRREHRGVTHQADGRMQVAP